jgi:hypothetical protein
MPTGLRYGVITHRHRYGTLVENMVREALRLSVTPQSELSAYIFGFTTHAVLDRRAHPFIGYHAGWVDPARPETKRLFHCHPFLERIIDVLMLRRLRGMELMDFDFFPLVRCGKSLPYQVVKTLVKSLNQTYPSLNYKSRDRKRIENAYRDTMFFYKVTNHRSHTLYKLAFKKDRKEEFKERRLALFHPPVIPEGIDFLNDGGRTWSHPCDRDATSTLGFMDLYRGALVEAVDQIREVHDVITRRASVEGLAEKIGEQSLDTGRDHCVPLYSNPFPLPEILDALYRKIEGQFPKLDSSRGDGISS